MLKAALVIIAALLGCTSLMAQDEGRGSAQEQRACSRDVSRYCRKEMNEGDRAIQKCLMQHRDKLTRACRDVLTSHKR